jgi:methionyl-tRNA formyltransferase
LRTIFLGTSDFAASVLERMAGGPHRPALVITRPDRPSGRGRRLAAPPVAQAAGRLGLALAQPQTVNDAETLGAIERAGAAEVETGPGGPMATGEPVVVVCAFGALIKEPLLSARPLLNVHPSLLPRWRGAAPIERAIMAGDAETGVSIMRLTEGLDSGPVCLAAREPIGPQDTYGSLAPRLAQLGGELLVRVLDSWERGERPAFIEQDETGVSYAEKIAPEDRMLDPVRPAHELERVVRALQPHIGARLALPDGAALGVKRARALPVGGVSGDAPHGAAPPAGVLACVDGRLLYGTGDGALELLEVQPPGKRPMEAASYLRGHELPRT